MTTPQRRLARLVEVAALLGLAAAVIPTARADAVDNAFVAAVHARGINFTSQQAAIIAGHEVCDELDLGKQKSDIASTVMANSRMDGYHAGYFVGAAIAAYCPRYRSS